LLSQQTIKQSQSNYSLRRCIAAIHIRHSSWDISLFVHIVVNTLDSLTNHLSEIQNRLRLNSVRLIIYFFFILSILFIIFFFSKNIDIYLY